MKVRLIDTTEDAKVVVVLDDGGTERRLVLNSIDTASLIMALRAQLEALTSNPEARSWVLPGMTHIQLGDYPTEMVLRVFLGGQLSHDYPVPKGSMLAQELGLMADRIAARQEAQALSSSPDSHGRKQ